MTKVCEKHGVEYAQRSGRWRCSECLKEGFRRYNAKHSKQRKDWHQSEAGRTSHQKYNSSAKGKATRARCLCNAKVLARKAVLRAIKAGKIIRPSFCSRCPCSEEIEAHHHLGYEKKHRLDIQWVCRSCHLSLHKEVGGVSSTAIV